MPKKGMKIDNKNQYVIYAIISIIGFLTMTSLFLTKGTYSINYENIPDNMVIDNSVVSSECDVIYNNTEEIKCRIKLDVSNDNMYNGIAVTYNSFDGLAYKSFTPAKDCSTSDGCIVEYSDKGFVYGNLSGFLKHELLGTITFRKTERNQSSGESEVALDSRNVELGISLSTINNELKVVSSSWYILTKSASGDQVIVDNIIKVDENKKIIKRIVDSTKYNDLETKVALTNYDSITFKNASGVIINKDNNIQTGSTIEITTSEENLNYKLAVLGDLTGDGYIKINDVSKLYRYIKGRINITDNAVLASGDITDDGVFRINDVSRLYRYMKNRISSLEVTE